ncbi:MAG: ADP-ribosylation factor-like protein [Promethearchaeota archaeon]
MEYLQEKKQEIKKIIFVGLENAGKTSIILTLKREFSKIADIEPTHGAKRRTFTLLGREINEWDLGGQKHYLISYLKNPNKFFDNTDSAIYVIDIQDTLRITESIKYLGDVVREFKNLKIVPSISVFFHKVDPVLIKESQVEISKHTSELTKQIKNLINYTKIRFFITTIYDTSTIIRAMSEVMLELYPKSHLIQKTITDFAKKLKCESLIVIDENSLIIGSFYTNDESKYMLTKALSHFLAFNDAFQLNGFDRSDDQMLVHKFGKYFLFKRINLKESVLPYYVLLLNSNPFDLYFIKREYDTFIRILKEIIYS